MPIGHLVKRSISLVFLFFSAIQHLSAQDHAATFEWTTCPSCPYPDADTAYLRNENIRCGYLTVPETRTPYNGRKLRIAVQVFKALTPNAAKPPMVILHGGPGGRAIGNFPPEYDPIRKESDIILVDQRGAGFSEPAFSPEMNQDILNIFARDLTPAAETKERVAAAAKVKDALVKKGIDIPSYNSREIAADIHDLCKLLGYTSWNIWGTSYGTRVALTMMRDFPEGINSVILAAPLPANVKYFQDITANFKHSLDLLCEKCKSDPGCNSSYPDLKQDFITAITNLEKSPIVLKMDDATRFPEGKFVINAQDMLLAFHQALYDRNNFPLIPILIEQLKARNEGALKHFVESMANGVFRLQYGAYYSVICSECIPFNSLKAFEDSSAGFWGGLSFYKDEFGICNIWNAGPFNDKDSATVSSTIPVLILSGEMDPIAATTGAESVKAALPNSFLYVFQNTGHFVGNGPAMDLIYKFLADPSRQPDATHYVKTAAIPFITGVHISNGISAMAPWMLRQKGNWWYGALIILIAVLFILTLFFAVKATKQLKKERHPFRVSFPFILMLLNTLLSAYFLVSILLSVLRTARENPQVLGFGLPGHYAGALTFPYIILGCYFILLLFWLFNRQKHETDKKYLLYFMMQLPFIGFLFFFGLFY
jgi:pimeloyl-ACP methyl ester carboxylesterase/uncharacterized integral membrane protein